MTEATTFALLALATAAATWFASFVSVPQPMDWTRAGDWHLRIVGLIALGVAVHFFFFHR